MGAPTKRARKIRTASEFSVPKLRAEIRPPIVSSGAYSWKLSDIVTARDAQMAGKFRLPARLAESMRTDDALAVARENRLAPQRCLGVELIPAKGARGATIAGEGEALFGLGGVGITPNALRDIHGTLIDHSVAFAVNTAAPREDGSRVDFSLQPWPIEWVYWFPTERCFMTQTEEGGLEKITHGDGRWVIFQEGEIEPWKNGAILAAAMVWARHAFAIRDWAKGSVAHGSAKVIGEMPAGMPLRDVNGLTVDAQDFIDLLRDIASSDAPVGLRPAGAKTDFLTNTSTAWQIFAELVGNAERSAARIYLGTDGTLGTNGGAPGVDIATLFGVATTKVQGDLACIERAIQTGVIEPWAACNFGDSSLAPSRRYVIPDADADAVKESLGKRNAAFSAALKGMKDAGLPITQEYVDGLAADYGVRAPIITVQAPTPTAADAPPALRVVP